MRKPQRFGHFHDFLRSRLAKRGAKKALADAIEVPLGNVTMWLHRGSPPNVDYASRVAKYYGVSLDYLVTGEDHIAGRNPELVDLWRLLLKLEDDREFLRIVRGMVRDRIARQDREPAASGPPPTSADQGATRAG